VAGFAAAGAGVVGAVVVFFVVVFEVAEEGAGVVFFVEETVLFGVAVEAGVAGFPVLDPELVSVVPVEVAVEGVVWADAPAVNRSIRAPAADP
jgi:hypothetical protein